MCKAVTPTFSTKNEVLCSFGLEFTVGFFASVARKPEEGSELILLAREPRQFTLVETSLVKKQLQRQNYFSSFQLCWEILSDVSDACSHGFV